MQRYRRGRGGSRSPIAGLDLPGVMADTEAFEISHAPDHLVVVGDTMLAHEVLGVHILGPHATDLIAEGALAVQVGATADDLAWTAHAHPRLPEAMLEAALGFRDAAIHFRNR
jgi:pyruvate/2-oxoglutarate dehydrogenase complex dihydrolipoamide dehydrogenase (E3) component